MNQENIREKIDELADEICNLVELLTDKPKEDNNGFYDYDDAVLFTESRDTTHTEFVDIISSIKGFNKYKGMIEIDDEGLVHYATGMTKEDYFKEE
jgi:hypothetical protein